MPDKDQHWRRILHRGVNANGGVGRPRPAADEKGRRTTGEFTESLRHERTATLLPDRNCPYLIRVTAHSLQCVEKALTRNGESGVHAMREQGFDDGFSALHFASPYGLSSTGTGR